mmetsp:Transcript_610/g.1106  ORF Transcript_610/g.1106 Transcript_610/m.1106 type:complete len:365 (+) Transcript_610:122-1216(+)|eukprot:CAMPEP_0176488948 /NCGR_PEP_ID=MMETSP0200_2-20121128/7001_1 /TAXON_ID=947934 /ORGANISM="Chaetoceros sp., Strain GSL56" /LENGTH=364 /DNA_ID=CAMNT_0017886005 /DNA_START=110 /DNA_END=1204 /DNA_ORIENTATION=+
MSKSNNECHDCGKRFNFFSPAQKCSNYEQCGNTICKKCLESHPLVLQSTSQHDSQNEDTRKEPLKVQCFCTSCFHEKSVLDFAKTFDVIEPTKQDGGNADANADGTSVQPSGIVFIFGHGGGGSRAMFRPHAQVLAQKFGHKCILLDFPGHGTAVKVPLDLNSCSDALTNVLQENNILPKDQGGKTIYIGASFGAYVGFHILQQHKEYFSGAILLDCGQNVGPGASLKARLGLWFLRQMGNLLSNKGLMEAMMGVTKKSHADYHLVESTYGAGMFFDQATAQVRCLEQVEPASLIAKIPFPMLFMNGMEDYRDSEEKWLSLCVDRDHSELKDYEHGDHFFTHDSRFVQDMLSRWDVFSRTVVVQ